LLRRPRLSAALLTAAVLGLTAVGWARLATVAPSTGVAGTLRATLPVDPTDLIAATGATELRASAEPRHVSAPSWLLAVDLSVAAVLLGLFLLNASDRRLVAAPTRWTRSSRAPPSGSEPRTR
jgi:hypothetical protein